MIIYFIIEDLLYHYLQKKFHTLDSGTESLIISVCRQFLFVIPVAYVFARMVTSGISGTWLLWLTFVIAEALSAIVAAIFMKKVYKHKILTMTLK